jgi:ADP-ribosylglycohydrolase
LSITDHMAAPPLKPLANSYWVRPGQLLAGEYPLTRNDAESAMRLQDLLLAGITCFINLTGPDELPIYEGRLPPRFGGKPVMHQRFAITDHGVPTSVQQMTTILDAIDAALSSGAGVYVHCRAGIGRTGTVMGCHLVRQGYSGAQAIEALNVLWQSSARSRDWPNVPETDDQENFILRFGEHAASRVVATARTGSLSQYQGALLGLAIGDVLGGVAADHAPTDLAELAGASNSLAGIHWSGDTAMTLALADSLLSCKQMQAEDQMQRYLSWQKQGAYSSDGQAGNVPPLMQKALGLWQWKRNPLAGSHDPALIDAHPLARCTAVALNFSDNPMQAMHAAAESARTTAQAPLVLDACRVFAALLSAIIAGASRPQLVQLNGAPAFVALRAGKLKPELQDLIDGRWRTAMIQPAGDDVLSVLASAIHAVVTTHNYQAAIFKAMHKATRPGSVAAVCGAVAGALYGVQELPIVWRETLPGRDQVLRTSERLLNEMPARNNQVS